MLFLETWKWKSHSRQADFKAHIPSFRLLLVAFLLKAEPCVYPEDNSTVRLMFPRRFMSYAAVGSNNFVHLLPLCLSSPF